MPARADKKKLKTLSDNLGLHVETVIAKRNEMRAKLKSLKSCSAAVNLLCDRVVPFEDVSIDAKSSHLSLKQAKSMKLKTVVDRYNKLLTVASMQNDAFQHMLKITSFMMQFAARYEQESGSFEKELLKIQNSVNKALGGKQTPQHKPRAKPKRKAVKTNGLDVGDCSGGEETDNSRFTLNLFC